MASTQSRREARTSPGPVAPWWCEALSTLGQGDPKLAVIIEGLGDHALRSRGEAFTTLARAIVGQQISVKAADAVWTRVSETCGATSSSDRIHPSQVIATSADSLRGSGLSQSKARYLHSLAEWFQSSPRLSQRLSSAQDAEVKAMLVQRPGIGPWTADMFLIFTLMRPDVFPDGDLGVLKAMGLLYFDGETPNRGRALDHAEQWRPYRTAASWLLWRSLDPVPVSY